MSGGGEAGDHVHQRQLLPEREPFPLPAVVLAAVAQQTRQVAPGDGMREALELDQRIVVEKWPELPKHPRLTSVGPLGPSPKNKQVGSLRFERQGDLRAKFEAGRGAFRGSDRARDALDAA